MGHTLTTDVHSINTIIRQQLQINQLSKCRLIFITLGLKFISEFVKEIITVRTVPPSKDETVKFNKKGL